ncbi:dTDP-glucose 4,6-dehydratase [Candidatus Peregrinibacteria bacterium HGW-Peregrinibacteria-1]|jgi:dTDP-glucose 4,6-dehydratase|nr:MAG: dTDP-glucose 4,6-dehydratase [Candidatus Peregrinibacteria bacterium HGW-Peregrinibacteria-1]
MKVLVTGGAGFIGSNYVHYHLEKYPEDEVVVLDKLTYAGNLDNLAAVMERNNFKFVQGDIADKAFLEALFEEEKFDTVINFAAETHVDRSITGPGIFVQTNIVGTHNLLEVARNSAVKRYHQVSTDEVYGDLGLDSIDFFLETTPLAPNCPYAASKASADLLVKSYFETYAMPVTISRCSNNYGPYQFPEKLIPYFFKLISEGREVPVYGDGLNVRDWLYVEDHCIAIDAIVKNGKYGEVYNIGGNNEKTNLEITKFLLNFLGRDESLIVYVDDRLAHDRRYAIDAGKMKRELGWEPSVTFAEGIQKTFDWYKQNSEWVKKLEGNLDERKHKMVSKEPLSASR